MKNKVKNYLKLSKLKVMIPVSLTGFTGYFISDPRITTGILLVTTGILMLAVSASVLNQVQESDIDSRMDRTRLRPLPAGNITRSNALLFCLISMAAGTLLIYSAGNMEAAAAGLFTIFWYNVVYTYAKRFTAFAVIPGAITGALPPLIGWIAAGGSPLDRTIIMIEFLFFIGQVPHFWLIVMKYGKEYESAGLPSLTRILSSNQIGRLTFIWIIASASAAIFLYTSGIIQNRILITILLTVSLILIYLFRDLVTFRGDKKSYRKYSGLLNGYYLVVIILLISDAIIK